MKAVILAGGRGKRLDELSAAKNKCMIEIGGKPVIYNSLNYAAASDVDSIVIVVGYRAEEIINDVGTSFNGKPIRYVIQQEQRGLVHAIECAKPAIGQADFLLLLGDEILENPRHQAMLDAFGREDIFGLCGVLEVQDRSQISRTYSIIQGPDKQIYRLVEKPKKPFNNIMGTGDCVFRNSILGYIDVTPIHHERQERELPDLIQCAIDEGHVVRSFTICDRYVNINTQQDVTAALQLRLP